MTEDTIKKHIFIDYANLDEQVKKMDKQLSELKKKREEKSKEAIRELTDNDIEKISIAGHTFSCHPFLTVKIKDQDMLFDDLEASGNDALIKRTVHYQSLRSHCKQMIEDGEAQPHGVEINFIDKLYMRTS